MRLSITEVEEARAAGCVLVDIRKSTSFGAAFIHGSINIGLTPSSANWLQMVCERSNELVLISDYEGEVAAAASQFQAAGYSKIRGFLDGGVHAWASAGRDLDHLPQLTAQSLRHVLDKYPDHLLLDVRTDDEWAGGHIERALHMPIARLIAGETPDVLTPERHVTTLCGIGYRANIAGSFLKASGYGHVYSVLGGLAAWNASGPR